MLQKKSDGHKLNFVSVLFLQVRLRKIQFVEDGRFWTISGDQLKAEQDSNSWFYIVPGLTGENDEYVSFQSASSRNYYIRHSSFLCWSHLYENTTLFKKDASFKEVHDSSGIRFTPFNLPTYSLAINLFGNIWIKLYSTSTIQHFQLRLIQGKRYLCLMMTLLQLL